MPSATTYVTPDDWTNASPLASARFQKLADSIEFLYRSRSGVTLSGAPGQTLTQTITDVAGATVSFSPLSAGSWLIVATFDLEITAADPGVCIGQIWVDGVQNGSQAYHQIGGGTGRNTPAAIAMPTLSAAAHTITLRAMKNGAGGTAKVNSATATAVRIS